MRNNLTFYPVIRRGFTNIAELAEVINRSRRYCEYRLNGSKVFTQREKNKIAEYLGVTVSEVIK